MTGKQALREAAEKATKGQWEVFAKPTPTYFDAIHSLAALLNGTSGDQKALYMINANGLCPALTGTGPNSANNAEFIAAFNPATVLALLDELEAKDKQISELSTGWGNCQETMGVYCHAYEEAKHAAAVDHEAACSLVEENEELKRKLAAAERRLAEQREYYEGVIADGSRRIAELEARMVKLPEALIPAIHNSGEPFMRPEPFGLYLNRDDVLKALRAAGVNQGA